MESLGTRTIEHDRGLGTAYERWCFYQRMAGWAEEYDVTTALEGPVDGMAGIRGVHCAGLAREGCDVVAAVASESAAKVARGVYAAAARVGHEPKVDVRIVDLKRLADLAPADLVLVYHALPFVDDWRAYLGTLGRLARKVLIVATCNPDNWGFTAVSWMGRVNAPETWRTDVLAPALWELGRVREHIYFDAPWWPDLPVAPGQSLGDRLKGMLVRRKGGARFAPPEQGAVLATKYVFGPDRWPYFGGPGWREELQPALLRHPSLEGAMAPIVRRAAHLHAFVVDMRPRTPQGRRRLAQVG